MRNGFDRESNPRPQRWPALMLISNIYITCTTAPLRQPVAPRCWRTVSCDTNIERAKWLLLYHVSWNFLISLRVFSFNTAMSAIIILYHLTCELKTLQNAQRNWVSSKKFVWKIDLVSNYRSEPRIEVEKSATHQCPIPATPWTMVTPLCRWNSPVACTYSGTVASRLYIYYVWRYSVSRLT
jgi:hypothetical protein